MKKLLLCLLLTCSVLSAETSYLTISNYSSFKEVQKEVHQLESYAKKNPDQFKIIKVEYKKAGESTDTPQKYGLDPLEFVFPFNAVIYLEDS